MNPEPGRTTGKNRKSLRWQGGSSLSDGHKKNCQTLIFNNFESLKLKTEIF